MYRYISYIPSCFPVVYEYDYATTMSFASVVYTYQLHRVSMCSLSLSFSMIHLQVIAITCLYHPPSFGFSLLLLFVACFVATGWGGMDPGEQGKVEKMV